MVLLATIPLAALSLALAADADGLADASAEPVQIVGGAMADPCQFPSVVSILEDDETPVMCSGSLIHPQVVMTAAHCIDPARPVVGLGFGEHGMATGVPEFVVPPIECVGNPLYYSGSGADVAYCLLSFPVTGVPIVPLMAGCEVEQVQPETEVVIVGFGADFGTVDEMGDVSASGVGPKRWTTQTIDFVDEFAEEVTMHGPNGSQSACFGDSGGPVMMQLDDGSWRVFGTGGHLYDPGGLPPPVIPENICGSGAAYGFSPFVNDWLEAETGLDLTPCWDGNVWTAAPECGSFPMSPHVGMGTWDTGCVGGALGGDVAPACADDPPPPPPPGTTTSSTDGGSDDLGETGLDDGTGETGDPRPADSGPIPTDPLPVGTGGESSGSSDDAGAMGEDVVERGCTCRARSEGGGSPAALGLLVLGLVARRRRR